MRAAAACTGIGLALLVPALAWAAERPGALALGEEAARRRPRMGLFGGLATLCCLGVVVVIILIVVLLARRRQPPRG